MVRILLYLFGACALLAGADRMIGNRFGLGRSFDRALELFPPIIASMAGILILAPAIAELLARVISPLYRALGLDPSLFGGVLAIDMGGYQIAESLADDPAIGKFSGVVLGATLGCTVSYGIPVGMEFCREGRSADFIRGTLYGIMTLPPAAFVGALLTGLSARTAAISCIPVLFLSALIAVGILFRPMGTEKVFRAFSAFLRVLSAVGLTLGAFQSITGLQLVKRLMSLEEALAIVASIGIVLLGALPFGELLTRLLRRPLAALSRRMKLSPETPSDLLLVYLTITPGLAALPQLDAAGCRAVAAFAVSGASALTAHLAFTLSFAPELAGPLLAAKTLGALLALCLSLLLERKRKA